jgi:DNA primase
MKDQLWFARGYCLVSTAPTGLQRKAFFPDDVLLTIREQTDIVHLIGEYVRLVPSGKSFKGLCPFHKEKTPSFYVIPDKQFFYCHGCQKGGDVFRFLMEVEHYRFPDAVAFLAARVGVSLDLDQDPETKRRKSLYDVLESAARLFAAQMSVVSGGEEARTYLHKRGVTPETALRFRMGYAPPGWNFLVNKLGTSPEALTLLQEAGLVKKGAEGKGFYDTFRQRLMIPILDINGRVVGFGGRSIHEGQDPKYLNSPETEVFNKRRILFNLKHALNEIRRTNSVVIVEGYLDVISLVQQGVENVVASLGTAMTPDHLQLISRNCERVFLCYDADEAGQRAILRAISMQKDTPVMARVVGFPQTTDDPDSFVRREGAEAFRHCLEGAQDIYSYIIARQTRDFPLPLDISAKEKIIAGLKPLTAEIQSPVARSEVAKRVAKLLDVDERTLGKTLFSQGSINMENGVSDRQQVVKKSVRQVGLAEEWVIRHLVESPLELDKARTLINPSDFSDPRLKRMYETLSGLFDRAGGIMKTPEILAALEDGDLGPRLSELLIALEDQPPPPFQECLRNLVKKRLEAEAKSIQQQIQQAEKEGDSEAVNRLMQRQMELIRKMNVLK